MILEEKEVLAIALSEVDEKIKIARKEHDKLKLHFYGDGKTKHLTQIQGLENKSQIDLRKDFAVSNQFLCNNLLRPLDHIWDAKGGSKLIQFKGNKEDTQREFIEKYLSDVRSGISLKAYFQTQWQDYMMTDPNGLLFVENNEVKAIETYKSIYHIKNQTFEGVRPEFVCFEPDEEDEETGFKLLWLVDDAKYYRVAIKDDVATIIEDETKENMYGFVPCTFNSIHFDTNREIKISPLSMLIDILDKYLNNNSIKEIYQFLMGYPIFWMYARACPECKGMGEINNENNTGRVTCPSCNGTKYDTKRDVSDVIHLRQPEEGEPVIAPDIAGYVQPDLATWEQMNNELDRTWDLIYFSFWGTSVEKQENETATGRFIDVQPVNSRLNQFADVVEILMNEHIKMFGMFYYPESFEKSDVSIGRRFLIETPDQVWQKYIQSKKDNAPVITLDEQLKQYYESEYQKNEVTQMYFIKLMGIEPFIHNSNDEVKDLMVNDLDKQTKYYFSDWIKTKTVKDIVSKDIEQLKNELNDFVNQKIKENGKSSKEGAEA